MTHVAAAAAAASTTQKERTYDAQAAANVLALWRRWRATPNGRRRKEGRSEGGAAAGDTFIFVHFSLKISISAGSFFAFPCSFMVPKYQRRHLFARLSSFHPSSFLPSLHGEWKKARIEPPPPLSLTIDVLW
jgi:hypothetical protein